MAENQLQLVDPTRKELILANGPVSVTQIGEMVVVSFTQVSPRVEGKGSGVSQNAFDAVVVSRIALPAEVARQLADLMRGLAVIRAPVAGNA